MAVAVGPASLEDYHAQIRLLQMIENLDSTNGLSRSCRSGHQDVFEEVAMGDKYCHSGPYLNRGWKSIGSQNRVVICLHVRGLLNRSAQEYCLPKLQVWKLRLGNQQAFPGLGKRVRRRGPRTSCTLGFAESGRRLGHTPPHRPADNPSSRAEHAHQGAADHRDVVLVCEGECSPTVSRSVGFVERGDAALYEPSASLRRCPLVARSGPRRLRLRTCYGQKGRDRPAWAFCSAL